METFLPGSESREFSPLLISYPRDMQEKAFLWALRVKPFQE